MTKKLLFILNFIALTAMASAQNLQLHFDPRHALYNDMGDRNYMTVTFEMFKPDRLGSTFMFVDLDFNQKHSNIGLAYMEISREFKFGNCPIMPHIEFNGGVGRGFTIENAYIAGAAFAKTFGKFNLSTHLSYRYNSFDKASHDVQWTGVWSANFFNNKMTFTGFMDVWTANKFRTETGFKSGKNVIFLSEPQIWYNISDKFSVGTEIEISSNFYNHKAYVIPTIGAKWNF